MMHFSMEKTRQILKQTPFVLEQLLQNVHADWIHCNEGPGTFSPYDVVGHLVHGEKTDWMTRARIILSDASDKQFSPYDRFAQYEESKGKTIQFLLKEFRLLRIKNLLILESWHLTDSDLQRTGIHPKFGEVTLKQLISTWTIHDLSHIAQITRVMCKHYKEDVGPWIEYMPILTRY